MVDTLAFRAVGFNATPWDMPFARSPMRFLALFAAKPTLDPLGFGSMARPN